MQCCCSAEAASLHHQPRCNDNYKRVLISSPAQRMTPSPHSTTSLGSRRQLCLRPKEWEEETMASSSAAHQTLLLTLFLSFVSALSSSSETDLLLTFKSSMEDPTLALSDWSPNSTNHCNWTGITCSKTTSLVTSVDLHGLNLTGDISPSICQLPQLSDLNLANNFFNEAISLRLSECTRLVTLNLSNNLLWGTFPDQIVLLSSLSTLDLSRNRIEGQIPVRLGSLERLQVLNLGSNLFSGIIRPPVFRNLSELVLLDLSQNPSLASELPREIGGLAKLRWLKMQRSGLYGAIPESFIGLHELEVLDLSQNNLTGKIPLGFGLGFLKLTALDFSQNMLSGSFPADVCYGKSLKQLSLLDNSFTGPIPYSIEKCLSLERFQVQDNGFSGELPSGLWSLPELKLVRAENNQFSGEMPDLAGVLSHLEQVQIDNNSFTGRIPGGLGMIRTMYRFSASLNGFSGDLPADIFDSPVLSIINLSHNSLTGSIPELRNCRKLVSLSLADNSLTGNIPPSLGHLPVLTYIDISSNRLSGEIPPELQNLKLALFNVSFNQLSGSVPTSLVSDLPASFLQGNPDLCGPGLPNPCNGPLKRRNSKTIGLFWAAIVVSIAVGFTVLIVGLYVVCRMLRGKPRSGAWKSVFFYPLGITEEELLMALVEKNVIGEGAFGKVHVLQLPGGEFVAVKRLLNSSNLSFRIVKAEIKTMAKARHRNVAKLLGFCYSKGTILLIFEYLKKGSLGDALHKPGFSLEWSFRLKLAIGSAHGLLYLHKDYVSQILHRNMKSNNILIGDGFEPKITDFGLDRIIGETSYRSSVASELGSYCYMPPEYGCSKKPTEQMDIYSFGVVLLELVTGRPAEQPEVRESLDVVKFVRRKVNMTNGALQVLDPKISSSAQQEMLEVLELALRCTSILPEKRPAIVEVVRSLQSLEPIAHPPMFSSELPSAE
ncbi:probably inactive leucine-rich repeat receptor-like protein kinase At5g06940 isoform X1 [Musa acuminata AAA Group]|uniref:probably inactive leucine-rich repeat receptor-like protein kinase At5g06940 isoform X1 n=2 Tax=Musa acuminata AAA Group TaxID=214697 RepID=UPI0031D65A66